MKNIHPSYHIFGATATPEESHALQEAYRNGAVIEAKGRDTIDIGYSWAVTTYPRWDFKNNYYRIKVN